MTLYHLCYSYNKQIEIDPPWPNKSVKRSKLYHQSFIDFDSLSSLFNQIPIVSLCKENCYILVWITNDPRCMDLVLCLILFLFSLDTSLQTMVLLISLQLTGLKSQRPINLLFHFLALLVKRRDLFQIFNQIRETCSWSVYH